MTRGSGHRKAGDSRHNRSPIRALAPIAPDRLIRRQLGIEGSLKDGWRDGVKRAVMKASRRPLPIAGPLQAIQLAWGKRLAAVGSGPAQGSGSA